LIDRASGAVRYLVWVGAAALYFIASYPFQGVLYSWCRDSAQIAFVVGGLVGAMALLSVHRGHVLQYRRSIKLAICALALTMLATLAAYANLTVVRELLLLVVVAAAVGVMSTGDQDLVRALIYITVVALIPSFLATAMFYAHWVDWPSWNVEHLDLPNTNPLVARQIGGDFEYYLPLWVAVIPHASAVDQGFGLTFVRQSFVYAEPSDLWYFVSGPFWIALADTRMPARTLCLAVMGIALALSFSVFGMLAIVVAMMFVAVMAVGGRLLVWLLGAIILLTLPFIPLYEWVQLVGSNKADEFSFYAQNVTVLSDVTLLGHAASQGEQPLSYGFLTVIYRYGMVGFGVTVCVAIAILWAAFRLLGDTAALGWRRYPLFIACFASVALLAKGTAIVPSMAALTLATAIGFRQSRVNPLTGRS
jgi:hypothetical protein